MVAPQNPQEHDTTPHARKVLQRGLISANVHQGGIFVHPLGTPSAERGDGTDVALL